MNKADFDETFGIFCGAYGKQPKNEQFMAKAHWLKFSHMQAKEYLDIICYAMDNHKLYPSVGALSEIKRVLDSQRQQPIKPLPTTKPKSKKSIRDYFVIANKDIEGKKRHHIEHLDLVKMYDSMKKRSKNKKKSELWKNSNIRKISDCF